MVAPATMRMSAAEFDVYAELPENADKLLELIGGEVVEVPSNPFVSYIAGRILIAIGIFLRSNDIGRLTGEGGGYMVAGERYAPDVAYISYARQPELARKGYNPNPPELAVEVISDSDNQKELRDLRRKLTGYLAAGTVVWVVDADLRTVEVHAAQGITIIPEDGTLDGGAVLPGFTLPVKDIFPAQPSE